MGNIDNLAEAIKHNCSPPFLPRGFVQVRIHTFDDGKRVLNIQIGNRDFSLDEDLHCTGSGSLIQDNWVIKAPE